MWWACLLQIGDCSGALARHSEHASHATFAAAPYMLILLAPVKVARFFNKRGPAASHLFSEWRVRRAGI